MVQEGGLGLNNKCLGLYKNAMGFETGDSQELELEVIRFDRNV
jgi:hypothetical protein